MRLSALMFGTALLAGCSNGPALQTRTPDPSAAPFQARAILVLSDVDMAGTAYADGVLKQLPEETDSVSVLTEFTGGAPSALLPASNSVMGWPGAMDVSPDGRFVYVVETRAPAAPGTEKIEEIFANMPVGRKLTALDLTEPARPQPLETIDVGREPTSVSVSPNGDFALIARRDRADALGVLFLQDGRPGELISLDLDIPDVGASEREQGVIFARIAPDGRHFVANIGNTHVLFGRFTEGVDGRPAGASWVGEPLAAGEWLSMARWSRDGRHVLFADVGWNGEATGYVLNGPGRVIAIRFDEAGDHSIASAVETSLSPEGFDLDPSGALLAVVNMERTYLPEGFPYALFGRRDRWSLSLVAFEEASGALSVVDGPVGFRGVLPEHAVFDRTGDAIAVAVFHDRVDAPQAGWIEYVRVDRRGASPRLVPTGVRAPTPRGAHQLAVIP